MVGVDRAFRSSTSSPSSSLPWCVIDQVTAVPLSRLLTTPAASPVDGEDRADDGWWPVSKPAFRPRPLARDWLPNARPRIVEECAIVAPSRFLGRARGVAYTRSCGHRSQRLVLDHLSGKRLARLRWAALVLSAVPLLACGAQRPFDAASGTATVSGHIYWPDCPSGGSGCPPLLGQPVHFSSASTSTHVMTTSDSSGAYSIRLHPGSYVVIAGHADRSVFQQQLTVKAGDTVTLNIPVSPATGAS